MELESLAIPIISTILIPIFTALAVAPEGSNQTRALISMGAAAILTILNEAMDGNPGSFNSLVETFGGVAGGQLLAYKLFQGLLGEKNLNHLLGSFGLGKISIDT